jgi:sialate O-acetylesterase
MPPLFPRGCRGAVSLSYDDALDVHLDHAVPDLETAGLRGTFYVPTAQQTVMCWQRRPADWKAIAERGHEIGNHTRVHPCNGGLNWVKPEHALERYDLAAIEAELRLANRELQDVVGPLGGRSFAYTCGEEWVSPQRISYRPVVDKLFIAARGGQPELADPMALDFRSVPSWVVSEKTALVDILGFLDRAAETGRWAVIQFHGVGGQHSLNVTREAHQAICHHLADRRDVLWIDTFVNVATHLRQALGRPWTPSN